jgi:hypothetical protein
MAGALVFCDPAGTRTQDPNIKSVVLYQLSYGISKRFRFFGSAKIGELEFAPNFSNKMFLFSLK